MRERRDPDRRGASGPEGRAWALLRGQGRGGPPSRLCARLSPASAVLAPWPAPSTLTVSFCCSPLSPTKASLCFLKAAIIGSCPEPSWGTR